MTTQIQPAGVTQGFAAMFNRPAPKLKNMPAYPKHLIALAGSKALDAVTESVDEDGAVIYAHPSYRIFGGGATQWRANEQNPEDYRENLASITGITIGIAHYRAYRGFDSGKVDDQGNPIFFRTCASLDLKFGAGNPGGVCANCHVRWRNENAPEDTPEYRGCENRCRIIVVQESGLPVILDLTGAASTGVKTYKRNLPDLPQHLVTEWTLGKHPKYNRSALVIGKPIGKFALTDEYKQALDWHAGYWAYALTSWQSMIADGADGKASGEIVEGQAAAPAAAVASTEVRAESRYAAMLGGGATTPEPPPPPPWDEDDGEEMQYDLDGNPVRAMAF